MASLKNKIEPDIYLENLFKSMTNYYYYGLYLELDYGIFKLDYDSEYLNIEMKKIKQLYVNEDLVVAKNNLIKKFLLSS